MYVNHFDNNWNQLWGKENATQKRIDKDGNTIDLWHNTSKITDGGTWQEGYEIQSNEKLIVRYSDKVKNGEAKDSTGNAYKYNGLSKNEYNKNWNIDNSKSLSAGNTQESITVDGGTASDITTVDFYYTTGAAKNREIFVNHLEYGSGEKLEGLANASQTILPDYRQTANMVGNSSYNNRGYMEYYNLPANLKMLLKNSSKLNTSNMVQVNGVWYKYKCYNTCSGATYDQALANTNGGRLTNQPR